MDLTIRGSLWFERRQVTKLLNMIAAGTLDLSSFEVDEYPLAEVGEALDATRRRRGLSSRSWFVVEMTTVGFFEYEG